MRQSLTLYLFISLYRVSCLALIDLIVGRFVKTVVSGLVELHRGVQDLSTFHIGGDEVANAWTNSPKCEELFEQGGFPSR